MSNRNQISGSLSLDVSGVASAVKDELRPALDDIRQQIALVVSMVAPAVLGIQQLADALARAGAQKPDQVAQRLISAGYALIVAEQTAQQPVQGDWFDRERVS